MLYDMEFLADASGRRVAAFGTMRVGNSFELFFSLQAMLASESTQDILGPP